MRKGEGLYLRWGNYPFMRSINPMGEDRFFHRAEHVYLQFGGDEAGQVDAITWQAGSGEPMRFTRVGN